MGFVIKKLNSRLQKADNGPLTIKLQIGSDPSGNFKELDFFVDTGLLASDCAISEELAAELGIKPNSSVDTVFPDGSSVNMKVGRCAVIVDGQGLDSGSCIIGSDIPTVGKSLLDLFEIFLKDGQILHIKLSDSAMKSLAPYSQSDIPE